MTASLVARLSKPCYNLAIKNKINIIKDIIIIGSNKARGKF
jgi:hypothetical protein